MSYNSKYTGAQIEQMLDGIRAYYNTLLAHSLLNYGDYRTGDAPHPKNALVRFGGHVWISLRETSAAPYSIYTDNEGNRFTYNGEGYVLADETQTADWELFF